MDARRKKVDPRKSIMVVDDDRDFLKEIGEMLKAHGYKPIAVADGASAIDAAKRSKPDAILVDIVMRNMNGFQVADKLNTWAETARIPVIAMTGWFVRDEHTRLMKMLGIKAVLIKPLKPEHVVSCVEMVLKK